MNKNVDLICQEIKRSPQENQQKNLEITEENTPDHQQPENSGTSKCGSSRFLETMLRVDIEFPSNRVVSLKSEFEEYLEENGLLDVKNNSQKERNPLGFNLKNK